MSTNQFEAWEDFISSLQNPFDQDEMEYDDMGEDWKRQLNALEILKGDEDFRKREQENENTVWSKFSTDCSSIEVENFNLFEVPQCSANLPAYLRHCVDKYGDEYSSQERSLLSETLLSWFMIEGKLGKALSEDRENAWRFRLGAMRATFKDMDKYLSRLIQCADVQVVFPAIYSALKENKEDSFLSLIEDFVKKEASYYTCIPIKDAILTLPAEKARDLLENRKIAEIAAHMGEENVISSGRKQKYKNFLHTWKPVRIVEFLDENLIGQKDAKKAAAMLLYTHVLRVAHPDADTKKSNFLFLGPTGCGKTELFRLLKKISPVDIHIVDSTSLTSEGFVGLNKGDLLKHLKEESEDNLETSIVVLDECDKFVRPEFSSSGENVNVSIQGDILKMVEGSKIFAGMSTIDTTRITFVFTGAFAGLLDREKASPVCGFMKESEAKQTINLEEKLCEYGMISELAGRISEFVVLEPLKKGDYLRILELVTKPENSTAALYSREDGIQMSFDPDALEEIAEQAMKSNLGARQLTNLVGQAVRQEVYDAMKDGRGEAVITKERICNLKRNNVARR